MSESWMAGRPSLTARCFEPVRLGSQTENDGKARESGIAIVKHWMHGYSHLWEEE
jgi:hypothetical protein